MSALAGVETSFLLFCGKSVLVMIMIMNLVLSYLNSQRGVKSQEENNLEVLLLLALGSIL